MKGTFSKAKKTVDHQLLSNISKNRRLFEHNAQKKKSGILNGETASSTVSNQNTYGVNTSGKRTSDMLLKKHDKSQKLLV